MIAQQEELDAERERFRLEIRRGMHRERGERERDHHDASLIWANANRLLGLDSAHLEGGELMRRRSL
jgi:hypothetical protein